MYKTTVFDIDFHDGSDFPYFTATVDIREDEEIKKENPIWSVRVLVFIERDDSLALGEIKKKAVDAAYNFLSNVAIAHSV